MTTAIAGVIKPPRRVATARFIPGFAIFTVVLASAFWFALIYQFNWGFADDFTFSVFHRWFVLGNDMDLRTLLLTRSTVHPWGAAMLFAMGILAVTGVSFTALVKTSFALLATAALLTTVTAVGEWRSKSACLLSFVAIPILTFHPIQTNELLWPIELAWFMITFLLILNVCMLEWAKAWAMPGVVVASLIATFCAAHGVFLWLVAAAHCLLLRDLRNRWIWAALLALAFVASIVLVSDKSEAAVGAGKAIGAVGYLLQVYGSLFGTRDPRWLWPLGTCLLGTFGACLLFLMRQPLGRVERMGAIVALASLMFAAAFLLARGSLAWALTWFHIAPMLAPFGVGLALLSLRAFDRTSRAKPIAILPCLLVLGSAASSLPYAFQRAEESMVSRALAMRLSCTEGTPEDLLIMANFLPMNPTLMRQSLPLLKPLCQASVPPKVAALLRFPQLFADMVAANPAADQALHDLWNVYITHGDLMQAFPIEDPDSPSRLLVWARGNAHTGSAYERPCPPAWAACPILGKHEAFFRQ
jgi:hypothetical protein